MYPTVAHKRAGSTFNTLTAAWLVTLAVSLLPAIVWNELGSNAPPWLPTAKLALLLGVIVAGWRVGWLAPLRPYILILFVLISAEWLSAELASTAFWRNLFPPNTGFARTMLGSQLLRLGVTGVVIAALWVIKRRRQAFYLTRGDLNAPAAPIPVLMSRPASWRRLGIILALCISGGTLAFLLVAGQPSPAALTALLPLLPFVVLFAAMNAFSEEVSYRNSMLGTVTDAVGAPQALLLSATFFGIGHFYGVPYGIVGVVMATVLGWLLGKSMLETRGMAWAWFIHFLQDVLIFTFLAIGFIAPGGN